MAGPDPSRRNFLKASALAGIGASLVGPSGASASLAADAKSSFVGDPALADLGRVPPRADGQFPVHTLTTKLATDAPRGLLRFGRHVDDGQRTPVARQMAIQ